VEEFEGLLRSSAQYLYGELERKIRTEHSFQESDLHISVHSLLHHLRLPPVSSEPFPELLRRSVDELLNEVGVSESIVRLSGIPVQMPSELLHALRSEQANDRTAIIRQLGREIASSPLGTAHLCKIYAEFSRERRGYLPLARRLLRAFISPEGLDRINAWLAVVRFCAAEIEYSSTFRSLNPPTRLAVVWGHGDRLFRTLCNAGVDVKWILDHFQNRRSAHLPMEVGHGPDPYVRDATHPRMVTAVGMALALMRYAAQPEELLSEELRNTVERMLSTDAKLVMALLTDVSLAPDHLTSVMRDGSQPAWLAVLPRMLQDSFSVEALRQQQATAVAKLRAGSNELEAWAALHAIVGDQALPAEQHDLMRDVLKTVDFVALYKKDKRLPYFAALPAAKQARYLGADALLNVQAQLLALAKAHAKGEVPANEASGDFLLSAAFELHAVSETGHPQTDRFAAMADLFDALVGHWPALAVRCKEFVDRMVDELPSADTREWWPLQVKLRSII
jgi:hypothetical protein